MRKLISKVKQVFCKHRFVIFHTHNGVELYDSKSYYDEWMVDKCSKCGKKKEVKND